MAMLSISPADEKRVKVMGFLSNKGTDNFSARIITVNGKITANKISALQKPRKIRNGNITFTTRLTVEVQGVPDKPDNFGLYCQGRAYHRGNGFKSPAGCVL
ncbi:MAG: hypothetical protein ACLTDS_03910 [Bianqueaceae bacterium]